jgi:hypothetical protein
LATPSAGESLQTGGSVTAAAAVENQWAVKLQVLKVDLK